MHVANVMVRALGYGTGGDAMMGTLDVPTWELLELGPDALDRVLDTFDANRDRALNYAVFE
ncbi:MAG: hypothetical protein E6J72_21565 [Deltaproteobacteria bacterium]|nr:MAG: hypothetical protein E6J72_21565 [Deltaproteobacteria bacterium]